MFGSERKGKDKWGVPLAWTRRGNEEPIFAFCSMLQCKQSEMNEYENAKCYMAKPLPCNTGGELPFQSDIAQKKARRRRLVRLQCIKPDVKTEEEAMITKEDNQGSKQERLVLNQAVFLQDLDQSCLAGKEVTTASETFCGEIDRSEVKAGNVEESGDSDPSVRDNLASASDSKVKCCCNDQYDEEQTAPPLAVSHYVVDPSTSLNTSRFRYLHQASSMPSTLSESTYFAEMAISSANDKAASSSVPLPWMNALFRFITGKKRE